MAFWFWTAAAATAAVAAAAIVRSSVRIRVRYARSGHFDRLTIIVKALYGLVRLRFTVPAIAVRCMSLVYEQKSTAQGKRKKSRFRLTRRSIRRYREAFRGIRQSTRGFGRWLRATARRVECTRWRMDATIGTGDAALTAAAAGLLWAALGCATAAAAHFLKLSAHPTGQVRPVYSGEELTLVWEADFRIRLGSLAMAGFKLATRTAHPFKAYRAWKQWTAKPEPV